MKVIGVREMSGVSKKSGRPYSGVMVWYTEPQSGVTGLSSDSAFLSDEVLGGLVVAVGDEVDIRYNRNGFVTGVTICHG